MSETFTKQCRTCKGHPQKPVPFQMFGCADCSGTGRVPDTEATLRAEVTRLTAEVEHQRLVADERASEVVRLKVLAVDGVRDVVTTVLHSVGAVAILRLEELTAENTRLTAEVERLEGREREAKPLVVALKHAGEYDESCPLCFGYWSEDGHGCDDGCPRAAWLAGCKP